jgi:hypothetical protein
MRPLYPRSEILVPIDRIPYIDWAGPEQIKGVCKNKFASSACPFPIAWKVPSKGRSVFREPMTIKVETPRLIRTKISGIRQVTLPVIPEESVKRFSGDSWPSAACQLF